MQEQSRFYLNPTHVRIIRGVKGAALYDLSGGEVIPIPPKFTSYLLDDDSGFVFDDREKDVLEGIVNSLYHKGLGQFNAYGENHTVEVDKVKSARDFAWLELTEKCNLRCVHCYAECGENTMGKKTMTLNEWKQALSAVRENGFERMQFIGGEPMMSPHFIPLLYEAEELQFKMIEVFSNLILVNDDILNSIKACGAQLATTLYSCDPNIHDEVTGIKGSFERTVDAIKDATKRRIPLRASCIVTHLNENKVGNLKAFVESLGATYGGEDLVRPTGRGTESVCKSTIPRHTVSLPFMTSRIDFSQAKHYNSCWNGKIAITEEGDVLPCIFARNLPTGNMKKQKLSDILETMTGPTGYWTLSKDKVEVCKDCEFRYACSDCRTMAKDWAKENLYAKTFGCPYDPYTGTWR